MCAWVEYGVRKGVEYGGGEERRWREGRSGDGEGEGWSMGEGRDSRVKKIEKVLKISGLKKLI